MLATPCTSFSVARDRTRPIRPSTRPWGLPHQNDADRARLRTGNACARATIQIMRWALEHKVKLILENPATSRLFLLPQSKEIMRHPAASYGIAHFCQYGTKWKTPTGFLMLFASENDRSSLYRRCNSSQGICSRTLAKHWVLSGLGPSGKPWTLIAQPYPSQLCSTLARILTARIHS